MLPVNSVKIDRAFAADLQHGSDSAVIAQSIVLLDKSLGKSIIAEGIETPEQVEQLLKMGCSLGQGYHLARPLAAEVIDGMLAGMVARAPSAPGPQRFERPLVFH
jgi:EAL domain-containing protein (putative c-di-GMP-specific phosphodiesterase class I)